MATCNDCLHFEVCKNMGTLMHSSLKSGTFTEDAESKCYIKCFKPTADVVEVVRCKGIVSIGEKRHIEVIVYPSLG